jgi:hypothetical protein
VFPSPGSRFASPETQIAFRGISISELGTISVTGSSSGDHPGRVRSDSDKRGGSFLPDKPFQPGETVTVTTGLDVAGGTDGTFSFVVATPAHPTELGGFPLAGRAHGDVLRFRSRPDLAPVAVTVTTTSPGAARGDIFLGPQLGPIQDGPMIVSPHGGLIWFKRLPADEFATDVRVQRLRGRPVLTWWQGQIGNGVGVGKDVIDDTSYRQVAVVHAANGLSADLHEFRLTRQGTALITAFYPVHTDARSVHGSPSQITEDAVVQEIDIPTGLVLFQWDSLDHVPLDGTHARVKVPFDYFHVNSVDEDTDGNLLISGRYTWSVYKVDHNTGATIWVLGGSHSTFTMRRGARFAYQHDVQALAGGDRLLTVLDNGEAGPERLVHPQSRGVIMHLDLGRHLATRISQLVHVPPLRSWYEGNVQMLPNGDAFIGWGEKPYFSEYDPKGGQIFDGRFVDHNSSYRAWRFPWHALPTAPPDVAFTTATGKITVYVSWNGATDVASWRVLGGASPYALNAVGMGRDRGFETSVSVPTEPYVAVQGLNATGKVLGQSMTIET